MFLSIVYFYLPLHITISETILQQLEKIVSVLMTRTLKLQNTMVNKRILERTAQYHYQRPKSNLRITKPKCNLHEQDISTFKHKRRGQRKIRTLTTLHTFQISFKDWSTLKFSFTRRCTCI